MLDGTTRLRLQDGTPLKHFLAVACFAERCVVPAASAVPIPEGITLRDAALVGCAVVTGFGAVRNAAQRAGRRERLRHRVRRRRAPGDRRLRLAGAEPIVAVDRVPEKLERALARGATHAVDASGEKPAREIRRIAGEGGVEHAFEVVGSTETIRLAWDALRPGGTAIVVGLAPAASRRSVPAIDFLVGEVAARLVLRLGIPGPGDRRARRARRRTAASTSAPTVSHVTDLDGIEEAFERLRRAEGAARSRFSTRRWPEASRHGSGDAGGGPEATAGEAQRS